MGEEMGGKGEEVVLSFERPCKHSKTAPKPSNPQGK